MGSDDSLTIDAIRDAHESTMRDHVNQEAGQALLRTALFAGGLGAGIAGLRRLLRLRTEQVDRDKSRRTTVRPIRIYSDANKAAADKNAGVIGDMTNSLIGAIGNVVGDAGRVTWDTIREGVRGTHAVRPIEKPWFAPATIAAATIPLGVGYVGAESLMKKLRQRSADAELAKARAEYEEALREEREGLKQSSERGELACNFDRIIACLDRQGVKVAGDESSPSMSRLVGLMLGLGLAGGTMAAGVGAYHGWNNEKSRRKRRAMQRAHQERVNTQRAFTPTPLLLESGGISQ